MRASEGITFSYPLRTFLKLFVSVLLFSTYIGWISVALDNITYFKPRHCSVE